MPARTMVGARVREEILGFQEFLERVEEDRFRRMITSPDLFERIFNDRPYEEFIRSTVNDLRSGHLDDRLTYRKRLRRRHRAGQVRRR